MGKLEGERERERMKCDRDSGPNLNKTGSICVICWRLSLCNTKIAKTLSQGDKTFCKKIKYLFLIKEKNMTIAVSFEIQDSFGSYCACLPCFFFFFAFFMFSPLITRPSLPCTMWLLKLANLSWSKGERNLQIKL